MNKIKFIISTMCLVATLGLFTSTFTFAQERKSIEEISAMPCVQQSLKDLKLYKKNKKNKKKSTLTDIKSNQTLIFLMKKNCKVSAKTSPGDSESACQKCTACGDPWGGSVAHQAYCSYNCFLCNP